MGNDLPTQHGHPQARRRAGRHRSSGRGLPLVAALLLICATLLSGWRPAAIAAGPDDLGVGLAADNDPLIGGTIAYTVTIANTSYVSSPENKAYNVTIEATLPVGVSFVGSTPALTPTITLVNSNTQQHLTFENVTDVARNQTVTFQIAATLAPAALSGVATPGTLLTADATVRASNNPRADATVVAGTAAVTNQALPFKLTKATAQSTAVNQVTGGCAGTGAGRLFSYTLTATNNTLGPSDTVIITETLPYGVDYCDTPFAQTQPSITYNADGTTVLIYALGTLTAGQVATITPQVAIPYTYPTVRNYPTNPPAPVTITNALAGTLVADDTVFVNRANMGGNYALNGYTTGEKAAPVTAKYATVDKGDDKSVVAYGDDLHYTLKVASSANYDIANIYLIDTIPNGEDFNATVPPSHPLSDGAQANSVYTPCGGATHTPGSGVYLCPDGTTVLTWGPLYDVTAMAANTEFTVTFQTTVRTTYREAGDPPIVAGDSLTNRVRLVYDAASIGAHTSPTNSVTRHEDSDAEGHTTVEPTLVKNVVDVRQGNGSVPPFGEGRVGAAGRSGYAAVGDIVTFRLDYDAHLIGTDQKNIVVTDFLPDGYKYIPGSASYGGIPGWTAYTGTINGVAQGSGTPDPECDPGCPASSALVFRLTGVGGNNIVPLGQTLRIEFKALVVAAGGARDNLGKFTGNGTNGAAYSGRDAVTLNDLAPLLTATKTNTATNPAFGNNVFEYTVTLTNDGDSTAYQLADLVDTLPADITVEPTLTATDPTVTIDPPGAAEFVSYSGGYGGTLRYKFNAPIGTTAPLNSVRITYKARIQPAPAVAAVRTNSAQVSFYNSQPVAAAPAPGLPVPGITYGPVTATSDVRIGGDVLAKTATVIEPRANGPAGRITIGDRVRYTLTYSIPANATIINGELRDCMPLGFHYLPGSYVGTIVSGTLPNPAGFALTDSHAGFSANNNGPDSTSSTGANSCPSDQQLVIIPVGTQTNTASAILLQADLTAVVTGKNRSGTPVFTTAPGPNNRRSNGTTANVNRAFVFQDGTRVATANVPNNGSDNNVYIPHLTLTKTVVRTSDPATLTYSVPAPASPLAREGSTVDYLLRLQNDGGSTAHDIAALIDTFAAPLTYVQAYQSGASCDTAIPLAGVTTLGPQAISLPAPASLAEGQSYYVCLRLTLGAGTTLSTLYSNQLQLGSGVGAKYYSAPSSLPNPPGAPRDFTADRVGYAQDQIAQATVRTPDLITFPALSDQVYGNGPVPLAATSSGGRPIDYSVTSGPCTIIGTPGNYQVRIDGAGTCDIKASQRGENLAPDVSNTFTIARAALTVAVNDLTRPFGAPNPPCTLLAGYPQGFVNGDDLGDLGGALACTTTAIPTSNPGTYPLTPGGYTSNNYTITYRPARLTVTACTVTLALQLPPGATVQYSDPATFRAQVNACGINPTGPVQFVIDSTIVGAAALDSQGLATLTVQVLQAAGSHTVTARFTSTDLRFTSATAGPSPLTVAQEHGTAAYTGRTSFAVNNATKRATVQLVATVRDISAVPGDPNHDSSPGDIRTAKVRFVNAATNQVIAGCDNLTVALVTASDLKVGTASCTFQSGNATLQVRVELLGNYTGTSAPATIVVGTGAALPGGATAAADRLADRRPHA